MAGVNVGLYLDLLDSGQFSDFVIDCDSIEFHVHRAIICPASPLLEAQCSEQPGRAQSQFPDANPAVMSRVILFLYANDYDVASLPGFYLKQYPNAEDLIEPFDDQDRDDAHSAMFHALRVHALVYQYADTLGIEDLKLKASGRFLEIAQVAFAFEGFEKPQLLMFETNYYSLIEDRKKTLEVVKENEPNVFNVYVLLLGPLMQVKERLEVSQDSLEATVARLEIVQSAGLELASTLKTMGIQCCHRQSVRLREVESKDGTLLTIKICYNCRYCDMHTGGD